MRTDTTGTMPLSAGMRIEHNNHSINGDDASLAGGSALLTLALAPLNGVDGLMFSTVLDFRFFETPNSIFGPSADIFVVMNPHVATETFTYQGHVYEFTFEASFNPLNGWYHEYARKKLGLKKKDALYGWTTPENENTGFLTELSIRCKEPAPTPEPATLACLGLGLAGLGLLRRRALKR